PDKKLVVVRYVNATPPPPPAPATAEPTVAPTPTPAPAATPYQDRFIAGDFIISPKVYNEFSPGNVGSNTGGASYAVRGAAEFNLFNLPWMLEGDYRQYNYPHNQNVATPPGLGGPGTAIPCPASGEPGCVTVIGGQGQTFVPAFTVRDYDFDGRLGLKVADPRLYVGVGYMYRGNNAGYPRLRGVGFGAEKLPDLNQSFSIYGSAWYYPNVKGNFSDPAGNTFSLAYNILKYQVGGTFTLGEHIPLFIDFGFLGDRGQNKTNAPSAFSENGPYVGLGLKF
ncbi:MAG: hypothetical protein M3Y21_05135, partial [Candidatus Eremiobacteraeota bacterium]|nr:hypothetical protein [Candidatus Eremiobacteraeota bacterium]